MKGSYQDCVILRQAELASFVVFLSKKRLADKSHIKYCVLFLNPLNAELNPICCLLA